MITITNEALQPDVITRHVEGSGSGAVVTFLGTTRDTTAHRKVLYLEYESYGPMAEKQLAQVDQEMRTMWTLEDVAISHRLGRLEIGDISLVVAVSAAHRKESFSACQYAVDRIKQTVPIWKKEYFEGGEIWVESPEDFVDRQIAQTTRN